MADLSNTDILNVIGNDTHLKKKANTNGGEFSGACPFCGGSDRFLVWPQHPSGRGKWWCRQCESGGDAIDYLREHGQSYRDAMRALGLETQLRTVSHSPSHNRQIQISYTATPAVDWQTDVMAAIHYCEETLWSSRAHVVREYLFGRGLTEDTLHTFHIGYCATGKPDWYGWKFGEIYVPRGIVIPTLVTGVPWQLKIRLLPGIPFKCSQCKTMLTQPGICPQCGGKNKYRGVQGNQAALFNADNLVAHGRPLVLCEGEFDAMLLHQEAGELVDVASLAGAGNKIGGRWLGYFLPYTLIMIAYDVDRAGSRGASKLAEILARAQTIRVPQGDDLTDFHLLGGDLKAWIQFYLARFGYSNDTVPNQSPSYQRFPLTMTIPADQAQLTGLVLPNKHWQRLTNGSISVTFQTADEMQTCREVTEAIRAETSYS